MFLTDYGHKQVKEIVAAGGYSIVRTLGGGYSFLFGTAVDGSGNLYVTDYGVNKVKKLVAVNGVIPTSPKILSLGGGFNIPAGLAVDGNGNVFVGDQNNNAVKEILASSGYTTTITVANTGFNTPDGIAIDKYGDIFVADDGNNVVKEIVAVNGVIPPSPTILVLGSGFLQPFDVAVDGNGNVYVADRGNNAVKEIQMAGGNFGPVNVGTISSSVIPMSFTFDAAGTLGSYSVVTQGVAGLDFYDGGGGSCIANTSYAVGAVMHGECEIQSACSGAALRRRGITEHNGGAAGNGTFAGNRRGPANHLCQGHGRRYSTGCAEHRGQRIQRPRRRGSGYEPEHLCRR